MTTPEEKREASKDNPNPTGSMPAGNRVPCEEIEPILFDYMSHELGQARATLVREHIRKCEKCRSTARGIQETLNLLKQASEEEKAADVRLTAERKRRVWRAFAHPVLDWAARHHVVVSALIAIIVLIVVWMMVRHVGSIWELPPGREPEIDDSVQVIIDGHGWKMVPTSNGVHKVLPYPE